MCICARARVAEEETQVPLDEIVDVTVRTPERWLCRTKQHYSTLLTFRQRARLTWWS